MMEVDGHVQADQRTLLGPFGASGGARKSPCSVDFTFSFFPCFVVGRYPMTDVSKGSLLMETPPVSSMLSMLSVWSIVSACAEHSLQQDTSMTLQAREIVKDGES